MSSNTKVSISGHRTFYIDRVDCTIDLGEDFLTGRKHDFFKGVIVKATFHNVTESGIENGNLVWTDNPIIQKYIDLRNSDSRTPRNSVFDQLTSEDEEFYEAFIEAVADMNGSVGPGITVGPIGGPSSCMSWDESC